MITMIKQGLLFHLKIKDQRNRRATKNHYDSRLTGLATYTNSEARVQTYTSMFELLCIQSEQLAFDNNYKKQVLPS